MAEAPERLFRDDTGAALERVAQLEEENRHLREEIARMQGVHPRSARDATTVRTARPSAVRAMLVAVLSLLLVGSAMMARVHGGGCVKRHRKVPVAPYTAPTLVPASTLAVTPAAPVEDESCATPYTYDAQRVKHYKMHCIHPERSR